MQYRCQIQGLNHESLSGYVIFCFFVATRPNVSFFSSVLGVGMITSQMFELWTLVKQSKVKFNWVFSRYSSGPFGSHFMLVPYNPKHNQLLDTCGRIGSYSIISIRILFASEHIKTNTSWPYQSQLIASNNLRSWQSKGKQWSVIIFRLLP